MGFMIFPDDYEYPDPDPPVTLTPTQRAQLKTLLQNYITNQNRPFYSDELALFAQQWVMINHSIVVSLDEIISILAEIRAEWGAPGE
jgi:ABC-type transporter MlaC component